jgi:hypothetical protein
MSDEFVRIVERPLDRKVIAFMGQNHIDPGLAVELFVLERIRSGLFAVRRVFSVRHSCSLRPVPGDRGPGTPQSE